MAPHKKKKISPADKVIMRAHEKPTLEALSQHDKLIKKIQAEVHPNFKESDVSFYMGSDGQAVVIAVTLKPGMYQEAVAKCIQELFPDMLPGKNNHHQIMLYYRPV